MTNKPPIEYIEWYDHHSGEDEWMEIGSVKRSDVVCRSAGFLVYEDNDQVQLATNLGDGDCADLMVIIKSCIKKRKKLSYK